MPTLARVTRRPLDLSEFLKEVPPAPAHGAQVVFSGIVRDHNHGRQVLAVGYDAFAPLTETVFQELAREAAQSWGADLAVSIVHRIGELVVGETSVIVVVSSPHRREAYEASRFVVDELKTRAPIWKQEHYVDGRSQWLPGHALCAHGETDIPARPLDEATSPHPEVHS